MAEQSQENRANGTAHAVLTRFQRRKLARFLRIAESTVDAVALISCTIFFLAFLPKVVIGDLPSTGGDMGSHYWPLYTLVHYALPQGDLHTWNPGNLGGEPHLVHYFPLPFLVMAALSWLMPLATAFNIGSLLALLLLPLTVYFGFRAAGWRFPAPLLATVFSLTFLYNESFSMWGGNTLSTLAGQFSHGYAFCFLALGIGALVHELKCRTFPWKSALLFAGVALSHAYILLGLPFVYLSCYLFVARGPSWRSFWSCLISGGFAIFLALWFLVPMVDNSPWTTAYFFKWISQNLLSEVFPVIFYPVLILGAISILLFFALPWYRWNRRRGAQLLLFWSLPTVAYCGYYFVFPWLGLVDVRAFPQVQFFVCLLAANLLALCLRPFRIPSLVLSATVVFLGLFWVERNVANFPGWLRWNYSSWNTKPAYPGLVKLSDAIRGDFSMPRVVYEHSMLNNKAGTERVFEMLPYFAQRATLESVYLQASILGPAAFLVQAEISKTPSCPFEQYECAPYDIAKAEERLKLLAVGSLILLTPELRAQADAAPFLEARGEYGQWKLYDLKEQPTLVELFSAAPLLSSDSYWQGKFRRRPPPGSPPEVSSVPVDPAKWKDLFYYWLKNYQPDMPYAIHPLTASQREQLTGLLSPSAAAKVWQGGEECVPQLLVDFGKLTLRTNCPGRAHLLKFAYHASWRADSDEPIFLTSPGYMTIIPSREEVVLRFGERFSWKAAGYCSAFSLLALVVLAVRFYRRRFIQ